MDYTEICLNLKHKDLEKAELIATMAADQGIYIEDYSSLEEEIDSIAHTDLIDENLLSKDKDLCKIHMYISSDNNLEDVILFLEERLKAENIDYTLDKTQVDIDSWLEKWKENYKPIEIGETLVVVPVWLKGKFFTQRQKIYIDPGVAFGTGEHETTKLCLELLEDYIRPGELLDVGTGSGILSIGALKLGAMKAYATDIDPLSVKYSAINAKLNFVEDRFFVEESSTLSHFNGKTFKNITANLVADLIINFSTDFDNLLDLDGTLIVSGIIKSREQDVLSAIVDKFDVIDKKEENDWLALALQKKRTVTLFD